MIVKEKISINASKAEVFSYLIDLENRKDYIPALVEVRMLDPLPISTGSRYVEVANIAGRKLETTYIVTALIVNEFVAAKTLESVFPIKVELQLAENRGSTMLAIKLEFTLRGIFKMASGIVSGIVRQQANGVLQNVKKNIESQGI